MKFKLEPEERLMLISVTVVILIAIVSFFELANYFNDYDMVNDNREDIIQITE